MDVLASTPLEHEDWLVAEVTAGAVCLWLRATGESLRLRRKGALAELKPGDVLRMKARETT